MRHVALRFWPVLLALLHGPNASEAFDANQQQAQAYKIVIQSALDVDTQEQKQKLNADTVLQYTWRRQGAERELTLDGLAVRVTNNGAAMVDTSMNRDKYVSSAPGPASTVTYDQAPEALQAMLRDAFRAPLFRYVLDERGNRTQQKVVAGPGAKMLVSNGMIANALMFHPFHPGQDQWKSDVEFSMGNGGYAKGQLHYKRIAGDKYEVTGTLTNPGYTQADTQVTVKDASYVVKGEETFDPQQQDWAEGKLAMDVSFKMQLGDKPIGITAGKMNVTFQRLPPARQ